MHKLQTKARNESIAEISIIISTISPSHHNKCIDVQVNKATAGIDGKTQKHWDLITRKENQ